MGTSHARPLAALLGVLLAGAHSRPAVALAPSQAPPPPRAPAGSASDSTRVRGAPAPDVAALAALLDRVVPAELAATRTPGAAIAVVAGDSVVFAKGYGVASVETGAPVTPDLLFRVASTTKMLTAAGVLTAAERGRLRLDGPVGASLPGLASRVAALPVRELLRHRAGLREGSSYYGPHDDAALPAFVRAWGDTVLFTAASDVYSYSNLGYALAGAALGAAAGRPYADAMAELVFRPVGMTRSTLRPMEAMTHPLAQGHDPDAAGRPAVVRPFSDDARYWPAGSVFTSAREFARFAVALLNGGRIGGVQALAPGVVAALLPRQTDVPGGPTAERAGYSYGLVVRDLPPALGGMRAFQHGGARVGFGSVVRLVPERRVGIVILANRTGAALTATLDSATALLVRPAESRTRAPQVAVSETQPAAAGPEPAPASAPAAQDVAALAGVYVNTPGELALELVVEGAELRLRPAGSRGIGAPAQRLPDGRWIAGGQPFALITGADGRTRYLVIAGHALRRQ